MRERNAKTEQRPSLSRVSCDRLIHLLPLQAPLPQWHLAQTVSTAEVTIGERIVPTLLDLVKTLGVAAMEERSLIRQLVLATERQ